MHKPNTASCFRLGLVAWLLGCVFGFTAFAQQPFGNLSGRVTDPAKGVIKGATVTATSLATGATRTTTTGDQGYFLLPTLQAGEYKLNITYTGFADFQVDRVVVAVGQTANIE